MMEGVMPSPGVKGSYEIISAFFFIIVAVVSALGLVYYAQMVQLSEASAISNAQRFTDATLSKERLLSCYGNTQIEYARIDDYCEIGPYLRAFTIEVLPTQGCDLEPIKRTLIDDETDAFVYFVPISHPDTGLQCLGKLTVNV
jgi:hypothetical protein